MFFNVNSYRYPESDDSIMTEVVKNPLEQSWEHHNSGNAS